MHWIAVVLLSLILTTANSAPTNALTATLSERQSSGDDLVTGIDWRDENGDVPLRREIRDLKDNHPDQWNLYILALSAMQMVDQGDDSSYYAVAGIHGRPYKTYRNAPGLPHKIGTTGYCPHNNALFLGWHRPYLALFEKELYDHMQGIALEAPADQVDRYSSAAGSFRIPYWDWAQGKAGGGVPDFFVQPSITVKTPSGDEKEIQNPLYDYKFKPLIEGDFTGKWAQANSTLRWPATDNSWEKSRNDQFESNFLSLQRSYQDGVEIAFRKSSLNTFGQQVEEVHGWMHGTIGGGYASEKGAQGHMWPLEYSAFEPLFWLHHTNIDRLFALYQAQNPDAWLEPSNIGTNGNVFIEDDTTIDADTPLLPFRRTPDSFWTTNEARDTTVFGYAYPETRSSNSSAARAAVARLYSGSTRDRLTAQIGSVKGHFMVDGERTFTDWVISTTADTQSLPPTFIVRFSLVGDFSSDPVTEVGMWSILMPMEHHKAERGVSLHQNASSRSVEGSVGMTASLLDEMSSGSLESLEATDVVPFLKDRLTWSVHSGNGTLLPQSDRDFITVQVTSTTAKIPSDPEEPLVYNGEVKVYPEITFKHGSEKTE